MTGLAHQSSYNIGPKEIAVIKRELFPALRLLWLAFFSVHRHCECRTPITGIATRKLSHKQESLESSPAKRKIIPTAQTEFDFLRVTSDF